MKHLKITNFGPLKHADVKLKDINVVIGPQSSGKSCLLKIASFCTWVEKRIQLTQKPEHFAKEGYFIQLLATFHKLEGYAKPKTYIVYETNSMKFTYRHSTEKFTFKWKEGRWDYHTPKVSYIPSERNMVAAIPNWFEVNMGDNNIRSFMSDWQKARLLQKDKLPILDLGVSYYYDKTNDKDKIVVKGTQPLDFTNTSSGLQSLIPLYVYLYYLTDQRFIAKEESNVQREMEYFHFSRLLYATLFTKSIKIVSQRIMKEGNPNASILIEKIGNSPFAFQSDQEAERFKSIYKHFTQLECNEIFIEEPEQNLFPPTQTLLVSHLLDIVNAKHPARLFVATHSPYVVTAFMEKLHQDRFALLVIAEEKNGLSSVRVASDEEIQQAYDYSIDLFYNINHIGT